MQWKSIAAIEFLLHIQTTQHAFSSKLATSTPYPVWIHQMRVYARTITYGELF